MSKEPISRIDSKNGKLYFRGLDATELARGKSFEDVTYLLIYGQLPSERESADFRGKMLNHRSLFQKEMPLILQEIGEYPDERLYKVANGIDRTDMMGLRPLAKHVSQFSEKYNLNPLDSVLAFVALCPEVLASGWRQLVGKSAVSQKRSLGYSHSFLWMLNEKELPPKDERDLEACFILHMDDPSNPSLNALEESINSGDTLSESLVSALDHHVDPLHHGAGEAVMKAMIDMGYTKNVEAYLSRALDKGERIFGLGHRIYRTIDPRAVMLRDILKGRTDNQAAYALFHRIEETARIGAQLIREKKNRTVYPNVDLYNAAVYHTFGIPYYMNTELFAVARAAGWAAHIAEWLELV
ncbi:MAG: citrate/2-methylcitrate synthase [Candidatus Thorarchaeota archaeon]